MYRINTVTGNFEPYKNKPTETNTISDNIPTLLADGSILWLADDINNGLSQLNLLTGHITDYLVGLGITCLYKDADSIIWAGTIGGLYRYNRATDNFNSFSEDNPGNNIVQGAAIPGDKETNLWISTETGMY